MCRRPWAARGPVLPGGRTCAAALHLCRPLHLCRRPALHLCRRPALHLRRRPALHLCGYRAELAGPRSGDEATEGRGEGTRSGARAWWAHGQRAHGVIAGARRPAVARIRPTHQPRRVKAREDTRPSSSRCPSGWAAQERSRSDAPEDAHFVRVGDAGSGGISSHHASTNAGAVAVRPRTARSAGGGRAHAGATAGRGRARSAVGFGGVAHSAWQPVSKGTSGRVRGVPQGKTIRSRG
ncbi:hypothetical protein DFH06DRAFT_54409 [Mycena polygramma]|nr:hypothetical protein DFH06DRAFT_54409 [Mycena polygramma]